MISLADGIARIGIVIGAPEQPRPRSRLLSLEISRVYFEPRIRCFVDHAKDSFAFHASEIRLNEVVMREVDYAVGCTGNGRQRLQDKQNPRDRRSHSGS